MKKLSPVGKVSKLFGNEGGVQVAVYDHVAGEIKVGEPLYVVIDMLTVPFFVSSVERRSAGSAVVVFDDMDTPERAEELVGLELSAPAVSDGDDDDGELYLDDLVGYAVRIRRSRQRGTITDFADNGLNPLFFVDFDGREVMVPAAPDFIRDVDERRRTVVFDLPDGLLDLQ